MPGSHAGQRPTWNPACSPKGLSRASVPFGPRDKGASEEGDTAFSLSTKLPSRCWSPAASGEAMAGKGRGRPLVPAEMHVPPRLGCGGSEVPEGGAGPQTPALLQPRADSSSQLRCPVLGQTAAQGAHATSPRWRLGVQVGTECAVLPKSSRLLPRASATPRPAWRACQGMEQSAATQGQPGLARTHAGQGAHHAPKGLHPTACEKRVFTACVVICHPVLLLCQQSP